MTPEGKVKAEIAKVLRAVQETRKLWYYMPVASQYSVAGIPDFVGCLDGRMWAIEAKAAKGKATALQVRTLDAMAKSGAYVGLVKPGDTPIDIQVMNILERL